jgi:hypothetical protein
LSVDRRKSANRVAKSTRVGDVAGFDVRGAKDQSSIKDDEKKPQSAPIALCGIKTKTRLTCKRSGLLHVRADVFDFNGPGLLFDLFDLNLPTLLARRRHQRNRSGKHAADDGKRRASTNDSSRFNQHNVLPRVAAVLFLRVCPCYRSATELIDGSKICRSHEYSVRWITLSREPPQPSQGRDACLKSESDKGRPERAL